MTGFVAAARAAAARLGVYAALRERPLATEELAAALGMGARRLGALVELLVAAGALRRTAGGALAVEGGGADEPVPGAAAIAEVVRRDRPLAPADPWSLQLDGRALAVGRLLATPRRELATHVAAELGDGDTFLDAGAGLGDVAAAVLAAAPRARVVLVDVPEVAAAARRRFPPGVEVRAGDLRLAPLPAARVALLCNVLHMHGPADAERIVAAVAAAVAPGGLLVVADVDRATLAGLAFDLGAAVHSDAGAAHGEAQLRAWLLAAGLARAERVGVAGALVLRARRR